MLRTDDQVHGGHRAKPRSRSPGDSGGVQCGRSQGRVVGLQKVFFARIMLTDAQRAMRLRTCASAGSPSQALPTKRVDTAYGYVSGCPSGMIAPLWGSFDDRHRPFDHAQGLAQVFTLEMREAIAQVEKEVPQGRPPEGSQ